MDSDAFRTGRHRSQPKRTFLRPLALALAMSSALASSACEGRIGGAGGNGKFDKVAQELCVVDTPIRRLTRFEYNNTVRDLLGDTSQPANILPPEEEVAGFNNQAGAHTVSDLLVEQFMKVAEDVSARAIRNMPAEFMNCDRGALGDEACALSFIETFGRRAFRRPLDPAEIARFKAVFDWAIAEPELGSFNDGIQTVMEAVLQSPSFLYRPELGSDTVVEGDIVAFTSWEMATKLSYMLWQTMPDAELFEAAEQDALRTPEQIAAQAQRMLLDDRARDTIRDFHRQWLLLTQLQSTSKDAGVYPAYRNSLRPLWEEEIQRFVEAVVLEGDGKLQTLLTADFSFMNAELADFYGADVIDSVDGAAFQRVALDPTRRSGVLTSAGLLAAHANYNQSSPVFRGKFIREQLMCDTLPLPPNDLVIEPPQLDPNKTTKEQFEEIGANPSCSGCHNLMNPIGFLFEHYDGIGQWRDQQNGKDIDASGDVIQTEDLDGTYYGAVELGQAMAQSEQVQQCVASQWFRFAYNRTVTEADACNLAQLNEAFAASDFNIRDLLLELTQTNAFLYRRAVDPEGGAQ